MFSSEFKISKRDLDGLRDVCCFIIRFYVKAWFRCTNPIEALRQDLEFLKAIHAYSTTDAEISRVTVKKFSTHLWYLSEETIALVFFDDKVSMEEKRLMVKTLKDQPEPVEMTRIFRLIIPPSRMTNIKDWKLHHFITENTVSFFARFDISINFMGKDPSMWKDDKEYTEIQSILRKLPVVNDHAERAVKLFSDYNRSIKKDEEGKPYLLQVVADYRKNDPGVTKSALSSI